MNFRHFLAASALCCILAPVATVARPIPSATPQVRVPTLPGHPGLPTTTPRGMHITSVRVAGGVGQVATFTVVVQNNTGIRVHSGGVFVGNNKTGSPYVEFSNLNPGESRTITLPSTYTIVANQGEEISDSQFEIGMVMDPNFTPSGEVWDQIWHRVAWQRATGGFNDTTFQR